MTTRRKTIEKQQPTAIDACVVALAPALIIGMIACLAFFLVVAFYRGDYDIRLMYLLGLFTVATVLIARIAIESGRRYAFLFSAPLALVASLAIFRFVQVSGPLAPIGWLLNLGLLALVWYLADRITFDCTLVDDRDASQQQGLLQSLGMLRKDPAQRTTSVKLPAPSNALSTDTASKSKSKRRKHNPGVWVLYFALLAFPLFGIGQLAIPEAGPRQAAFYFLVGYLGCALCLLVTTSFLGMRRYLRQKGVEMPAAMNANWLGAGFLGIATILAVASLLPLPGYSLGLVGWPLHFTSAENLQTNRWGWGKEGQTKDSQTEQNAQTTGQEGPPTGSADPEGKGNPEASDQASQDSPKQAGESSDQSSSASDPSSSTSDSPPPPASDTQPPSASDMQPSAAEKSSNTQNPREQSSSPDKSPTQATNDGDAPSDDRTARDSNSPAEPQDSASQETPNSPQTDAPQETSRTPDQHTDSSSSLSLPDWMSLNPDLFKWIAIAMLAAFILLYLITHPGELRKLWQELLRLWGSLFGRGDRAFPADEDPQVEKNFKPRTPPRPFATYVDPFSTSSQRLSPAQIVTHSFAALEAWGAEHGMRRQEEQTAAEFARILSRRAASLGDSPVQAAQFLDRLMFAGWQPQIGEVQPLKDLWVKLRKGMPPPQE